MKKNPTMQTVPNIPKALQVPNLETSILKLIVTTKLQDQLKKVAAAAAHPRILPGNTSPIISLKV